MCIGSPKISAPPQASTPPPPVIETIKLDKSATAAGEDMAKQKKRQGFASTILSQAGNTDTLNPNTTMGQALKSKLGV